MEVKTVLTDAVLNALNADNIRGDLDVRDIKLEEQQAGGAALDGNINVACDLAVACAAFRADTVFVCAALSYRVRFSFSAVHALIAVCSVAVENVAMVMLCVVGVLDQLGCSSRATKNVPSVCVSCAKLTIGSLASSYSSQ